MSLTVKKKVNYNPTKKSASPATKINQLQSRRKTTSLPKRIYFRGTETSNSPKLKNKDQ